MDTLKKNKEDGTVMQGVVRLTQYDQELDTDVIMIEYQGESVVITRKEVEIKPTKRSLVNFVGETVEFQVIDIDEETGVVYGSMKRLKEAMLDGLAKELEEGAVKKAKVTKILNYGAYLLVDGMSVQMLNKDFSEDYTTIRDIMKEGDTIDVVFSRYTPTKNLRVKAKEMYKSDSVMSFDKLEPNQVILGTVRNVKPWGAYVCIAPNLDALCPAPPNMDIQEGDKVKFKITQVRDEEKRVRGKIIKMLNNQ